MAANMIVLFAFFTVLYGCSATPICKERPSFELLDCSRLRLSSLPHFWQPRAWVKFLNLKRNLFVELNFSLAECFPSLQEVDLRENPFNCSSLLPLININVRSDCELRRTVLPPTTTNIVVNVKTPTPVVASFSQLRTVFTTHRAGNVEGRVLLISLLSSFCVLTSVVVSSVFWIIWKRRVTRRTDTDQFTMFNMRRFSSSSSLSSDDDCVIYSRESTL